MPKNHLYMNTNTTLAIFSVKLHQWSLNLTLYLSGQADDFDGVADNTSSGTQIYFSAIFLLITTAILFS